MVTEVNPTCVACSPRYAGDSSDGIGHWVIDKRVCSICQGAPCSVVATTRVDEIADGRGRYVSARDRQVCVLLHPGSRRGKLPDPIIPAYVNVESTKSVELVIEHREATGDNVLVARRPGSGYGADHVSNRVIAEGATARGLAGEIRAAHTIDVRYPALSKHAATHVVRKRVGVTG